MKTLKDSLNTISKAKTHYDSMREQNMYAVNVKVYDYEIPADVDQQMVSAALQDGATMDDLWDNAKSTFNEACPDIELHWFGRNFGWIGIETVNVGDYDLNDEHDVAMLSQIAEAIDHLDTIRSFMFNWLWDEACLRQNLKLD